MKKSKYVWVALSFCLAACGADGAGKDNSKASVSTALGSSAEDIFAEQFAGKYALDSSNCAAFPLASTATLNAKRFRLGDAACDMSDLKTNSNGDEMSFALSNCEGPDAPQEDPIITLKRVEEGLELSASNGLALTLNFCGK